MANNKILVYALGFAVIILPIILFGIAINLVQNHNDDSGRGYMAGLIIFLILYLGSLLLVWKIKERSLIFLPLTFIALIALSSSAINKYR